MQRISAPGERSPNPSIDGTSWIAPGAVLIGDVHIGNEASVWFGAVLRSGDDRITIGAKGNIRDGCVLHVDAGYPIVVSENCTIGHRAILHGCTIGANTLVGMGATVLNGAKVGRNCILGANAFFIEDEATWDNSYDIRWIPSGCGSQLRSRAPRACDTAPRPHRPDAVSLVVGAPGRVMRSIDEVGVRKPTAFAEQYATRWRRYQRELTSKGGER